MRIGLPLIPIFCGVAFVATMGTLGFRPAESQDSRAVAPSRVLSGTGTDIKGLATVIDGDTIEIRGMRIRLFGIDAPEDGQFCTRGGRPWLCGSEAALQLDSFVKHFEVICDAQDRDRYGRLVAICRTSRGDIGEWIVSKGLALDWPRYSSGRYAKNQDMAKSQKLGMWAGDFVAPWDFRYCKSKRRPINECSLGASVR
jgi:endonuclease YncB( thermonuclease family)